jgi:hypothetical protein
MAAARARHLPDFCHPQSITFNFKHTRRNLNVQLLEVGHALDQLQTALRMKTLKGRDELEMLLSQKMIQLTQIFDGEVSVRSR